MADKNKNKVNTAAQTGNDNTEQYSLNDDRRVKVLSPGALVAKRFFRNRLAVTGLSIILLMFVFSFLGGVVSPYGEKEQFYRIDTTNKEYASVITNEEYRYLADDRDANGYYSGMAQSKSLLAIQKKQETFENKGIEYRIEYEEGDLCVIYVDDQVVGIAYKDIVNADVPASFEFTYRSLLAYVNSETEFEADGRTYTINDDGEIFDGPAEIGYVSRFIVKAILPDVVLSKRFKAELQETIEDNGTTFVFTEDNGDVSEYKISYDAYRKSYSVQQGTATRVFDTYASPSKEHWLGTDGNGMDMLTRLMYGGRVSLIIGFIVVFIETFVGVIFGGIAGYFGGWVDNLIMRIVDIFYCIPSTPILIIIGAAMDAYNVDPQIRMLYLMLILGFLGWAGIARLVRGQILSLREQEFMAATEAGGIRVSRRIFKHLIPNVIPQLIVTMTMGLGSTILTEAALSFLGLGVRFPFASWGNIINDVTNTYVLTTYLFVWIPAGICLLATVLAFNLVGDGLRDAFDPKMKR